MSSLRSLALIRPVAGSRRDEWTWSQPVRAMIARGEDLDPAYGPLDQVGDPPGAAQGGRPLAAGHDASDAQIDQLLQRKERVADVVEGAVEDGDGVRSDRAHHPPAAIDVHVALR